MPFTRNVCRVSGFPKKGGNRDDAIGKVSLVSEYIRLEILAPHAGNMVVVTGEHHRTGYSAERGRMKLRKSYTLGNQSVQVWSFDIAAKCAQVGIADIISYN